MREKIIFYIPSIEGGGVEKNFFLLLKYLSKKIDKIYVVTADKKKSNSRHVKYICPNSSKWEGDWSPWANFRRFIGGNSSWRPCFRFRIGLGRNRKDSATPI